MLTDNIQARILAPLQKLSAGLAQELIAQGHQATGDLIKSFYEHVESAPDGIILQVWSNVDYGLYVDRGRKPGSYVPISVLIRWVQIKGIDVKWNMSAKSAAFAINGAIKKHGIPTPGSLQYSSTGKRTDFIQAALDRLLPDFYNEVSKILEEELEKAMLGTFGKVG